jgi:alkylated DNA repair protein alkB family protein 1
MQSDPSTEKDRPKKQRKINSFPLSKLRYVNLGEWNYNWNDRRYEKIQNAMTLPDRLVSLAHHAHDIAKRQTNAESTPSIPFDMAICNVYHLQRPSDRLGGHQDDVESDLSLPLVTVSLGAPGIFLLGGRSREDVPTAILLRAGDCMILSGNSRGYFHGVPSVLSNELVDDSACCGCPVEETHCLFPELNESGTLISNADIDNPSIPLLDEMRFADALLSTVRMNISIRRV